MAAVSPSATVALVCKPWRGGLGRYLAMALERRFPRLLPSIHTYPSTPDERRAYRRDRHSWRQRLTDRVESLDADVVIFLNLLPEFERLQLKNESVLWLTDDPQPILASLDPFKHVFVSDPGYADLVQQAVGGSRFAGVLHFGCEPEIHKAVSFRKDANGCCFIANSDRKRDQVLAKLFAQGRRLKVYGNYFGRHRLFWRHPFCFRPSVANDDMGAIYARHSVSLNIHADVVKEGTNMRTFECAAYEIPQIVEHRPGIETLFDADSEIHFYHSMDELHDLMARIDKDPGDARQRALLARRRCLTEHTYEHRIKQMMGVL